MKTVPIIDINTGKRINGDELRCMDCGKKIDRRREAPSGSFIPRCEKCNSKRWQQYQKQCEDPHSCVGLPPLSREEDMWG